MLKMPRAICESIIAHARGGLPLEVCGLLGGNGGEIVSIHRMTNIDESNEHFMMDPKEQFAVVKELRARGLRMIGIYHSHPATPARPSDEDIRLALTPDVSYVIVSLAETERPVMKAFRIAGGMSDPEGLTVLE